MKLPNAAPKNQKPSVKFRNAMRQILSVTKKEIDRREADYKKQRAKEKQSANRG
jgi:hypothetical protein